MLDWRSGRERHRPLELADSPLRVAISPDSNLLVVTTGTYLHGHYRELASSLDLHSGRVLARDIPLPGPLAGLRYSPNSRFLVHWRESEVQVRDASSLAPIAAPAPIPAKPYSVIGVSITRLGPNSSSSPCVTL